MAISWEIKKRISKERSVERLISLFRSFQGKMNQVADYYGEHLVVGAVDREKIRRHRFTLPPLFRQERFKLAIRELNRVWKKRCVSFNSKNKESGGDP